MARLGETSGSRVARRSAFRLAAGMETAHVTLSSTATILSLSSPRADVIVKVIGRKRRTLWLVVTGRQKTKGRERHATAPDGRRTLYPASHRGSPTGPVRSYGQGECIGIGRMACLYRMGGRDGPQSHDNAQHAEKEVNVVAVAVAELMGTGARGISGPESPCKRGVESYMIGRQISLAPSDKRIEVVG
jgi:hypothetical protein